MFWIAIAAAAALLSGQAEDLSGGAVPPVEGSLADDTLRGDVMRTVLTNAEAIAPGCNSAEAARTGTTGVARVTSAPDAAGVWQEIWPISICGQQRSLQLDFTPTPQTGGTDFRLRLAEGDGETGGKRR